MNVIATSLVRLSTHPLSFQRDGRRYHVILGQSVCTTPQMEREEGTGGSPDVRQAWKGKFRAKKQKMASRKLPQARSCKGPATSISPSSFDTSLSTFLLSHRICSILTGPLLSTPRRSITTRTPTCRAPRPLSTFLALVLPPALAILPTSSNGTYSIARHAGVAP